MNATRHARFLVNVASGDTLDVRHFAVHERISTLFSVVLTVVSEIADLDFEAIIGQPASFVIEGGVLSSTQTRIWTGVCSEIHEVALEEKGLSTYTLEIVPSLWLATQRRNHRMFQLLSDVDIALELLSDWGIAPIQQLSSTYKKRKYRVQYGESDYAFLCRMLEDAGVSFYFVGDSGQSRLVLSDAPQTNDLRQPLVTFRDRPGDPNLEHVTALRIGRKVRPGRYTVRDHDYRRQPSFRLLATAEAAGLSGIEGQLERFHYLPGAFLFESTKGDATPHADDKGRYRIDDAEGTALAQRRLEARRSEATTIAFETNVVDLAPGVVMALRQHPRRDLDEDRRLLIIESKLVGSAGQEWKIQCEARRADVPFRPPMTTRKPTVNGVESATVVGPSGEEIHTDEFGRVRCHFHWDRESQMDENSSCWIHVSQPWGGTGFGGLNLPRIGQEVLVDFLGGDPDRPVIIGRMYTNLQRVPYTLPQNKTQSGWKSNSTTNTGGYNEMMFEDAAGQELLRMQAEKDMHKLVKHDEEATVGNDRTRNVGRDEAVMIGRDLSKQVARNEREQTGQNRSIMVGVNRSTQIGNNDSNSVGVKWVTMIVPPGEAGASSSSSITMTDKKIVLDTGAGATITMDKDKITIVAEDLVEIWGKKRGVNLHAPHPNGAVGLNSKKNFAVNADTVSINGKSSAAFSSSGGNVKIDGTEVIINGPGFPCGRVGDPVGGTILKGSPTVLVGGGPASAFGKDVDDIIAKSPTLTKNLKELEAKGWHVVWGEAGAGSFTDREHSQIVLDPSQAGNANETAQTLAHESGHAMYTPEPEVPMDGLTKQQYVDANTNRDLRDEGEATMTNAKVREEVKQNGGPDIGIAGAQSDKYQGIYEKYPDPKDRDKARQEIGTLFADGEHPSTEKDPSVTYRKYYSQPYQDEWDKRHPAGKP